MKKIFFAIFCLVTTAVLADNSWVKNQEAVEQVKAICAIQKNACEKLSCDVDTVDSFRSLISEMKNCHKDVVENKLSYEPKAKEDPKVEEVEKDENVEEKAEDKAEENLETEQSEVEDEPGEKDKGAEQTADEGDVADDSKTEDEPEVKEQAENPEENPESDKQNPEKPEDGKSEDEAEKEEKVPEVPAQPAPEQSGKRADEVSCNEELPFFISDDEEIKYINKCLEEKKGKKNLEEGYVFKSAISGKAKGRSTAKRFAEDSISVDKTIDNDTCSPLTVIYTCSEKNSLGNCSYYKAGVLEKCKKKTVPAQPAPGQSGDGKKYKTLAEAHAIIDAKLEKCKQDYDFLENPIWIIGHSYEKALGKSGGNYNAAKYAGRDASKQEKEMGVSCRQDCIYYEQFEDFQEKNVYWTAGVLYGCKKNNS